VLIDKMVSVGSRAAFASSARATPADPVTDRLDLPAVVILFGIGDELVDAHVPTKDFALI